MYKLNMILEIAIQEFEGKGPNEIARMVDAQITWPIRLGEFANELRKTSNALLVIINNPEIHSYLEENDPKALQQCLDAIHAEIVR